MGMQWKFWTERAIIPELFIATLHWDRTRIPDQMGDFGLERIHDAGPVHKTWQNYTTVQILVPIAAGFGSIAIKLF